MATILCVKKGAAGGAWGQLMAQGACWNYAQTLMAWDISPEAILLPPSTPSIYLHIVQYRTPYFMSDLVCRSVCTYTIQTHCLSRSRRRTRRHTHKHRNREEDAWADGMCKDNSFVLLHRLSISSLPSEQSSKKKKDSNEIISPGSQVVQGN